MPKNQTSTLTVTDWPPVVGAPGLTQGQYGTAGNLELVAPAEDDGIWVGWFNNDPTEAHQGAAIGRWSGVLRFASGSRYVAAEVTQVAAGPDFIEVVALTVDGELRRHVWSPDSGFVDTGTLATGIVAASGLVASPTSHGDNEFRISAICADGQLAELRASVGSSYPRLDFDKATTEPAVDKTRVTAADVDAAWHVDHLDIVTVSEGRAALRCALLSSAQTDLGPATAARIAIGSDGTRRTLTVDSEGRAQLRAGELEPMDLGPADAVAVAAVRRNERVDIDVLLRRGVHLWHGSLGSQPLERVRAEVWIADDNPDAHRG